MKLLMLLVGTTYSMVNLVPFPWRLRLLWLRFTFFLIVKGTLWFPSILGFVEEQNSVYQMGKQKGEGYQSLVLLEKVLEHLEADGVDPHRVKRVLEQAEAEGVPAEELGAFLAQRTLDPVETDKVLKTSLESMRY